MTTLREFLDGETLVYRDARGRPVEATYRAGVGVFLERDGKDLGCVAVASDDDGAKRVFWNLTRKGTDDGDEED